MIKKVILIAILSIVVHKIYRYYKFMGYASSRKTLDMFQPASCSNKYENLAGSSSNDRRKVLKIPNTLDSDVLPNGICMFSSGGLYPFIWFDKSTFQPLLSHYKNERSSIYMLDMNYLDQLKPIALDIVNSEGEIQNDFNLFAISIYQDESQNFKLAAANFDHATNSTRVHKFSYDLNRHVLVRLDSPLSRVNLDGICDLVVVEDYLIYFAKCFSDSKYAEYLFDLEIKTGEIWMVNLIDNVMFRVASNLFFPKSIAYLRSWDVIVVTNLAADGLSLFKREPNMRLSKISDISLDSFVFSIHTDTEDNLWLVMHPVLYESVSFFRSAGSGAPKLASRLAKLKLEIKNNVLVNYEIREIVRTDGSFLNAVGSSVYYNNFLMMFSFVSDPKVCLL